MFNIKQGAHVDNWSGYFASRVLQSHIPNLMLGQLVMPSQGKFVLADGTTNITTQVKTAEFVFETDQRQSSGTITTHTGTAEYETDIYVGTPAVDSLLGIDPAGSGKLAVVTDITHANWYVLSTNGKFITFKSLQ